MDMRHVIKFETPAGGEIKQLLVNRGATPDEYDTDWRVPSSAAFTRLEAELKQREVRFDVFFELWPSTGEDPANFAAYLTLQYLDHLDVAGADRILAKDDKTFTTVANPKVVAILDEISTGLTWTAHEGGHDLFALSSSMPLPDPIVIPRVVWSSQSPTTGNWAIQSDGRELLTANNLRAVQEHGVMHASSCSAEGRVLPWTPVLVFSGAVATRLLHEDIRGVADQPVFLAPE